MGTEHLHSPAANAKRAATRAAKQTESRSYHTPGSETTDLRAGELVEAHREWDRSGIWARYEGRKGWVVSVNAETTPRGSYVEIGVSWQWEADTAKMAAETWFRADELRRA